MPLQKIAFIAPRIRQYVPATLGPVIPAIYLAGYPVPVLMGGSYELGSTLKGIGDGGAQVVTKTGQSENGRKPRGRPIGSTTRVNGKNKVQSSVGNLRVRRGAKGQFTSSGAGNKSGKGKKAKKA